MIEFPYTGVRNKTHFRYWSWFLSLISFYLLLPHSCNSHSAKLQQIQQVNYFAYIKKENLIDIVAEGLMVYAKRKKKSAVLHNKGRHFRPQLISVLQVSLDHWSDIRSISFKTSIARLQNNFSFRYRVQRASVSYYKTESSIPTKNLLTLYLCK